MNVLQIRNALPGKGQDASPLFLSTGKKDNFCNLRVFGCQVWVRPTGFGKKCFKDDARKGIFLGYVLHTDRLIIYYDCESEQVKITSHCKFDEGFNDLPIESVPLGFQQLIWENRDEKIPIDSTDITSSDLDFFIYPFEYKEITEIPVLPHETDDHFGFKLKNDELYGHVYVDKIKDKSSVHHAFNKSTRNHLHGYFITHIDGEPIFNAKDAALKLQHLYQDHLQ